MAQTTQENSRAPEEMQKLEARHQRLQTLVVELLQANQELRFKVEQLESRAESAEHGLANACAVAGMLLP